MLTQEREILKAESIVEEMVELVLSAGEEGWRIDEVERALLRGDDSFPSPAPEP